MIKYIYKLYKNSPIISKNCHLKLYKEYCITNDNALFFSALLMILNYSLAIWKINHNALSLFFLANAQMSDRIYYIAGHLSAHATQGKIIYYY